jgi:RNA polymerase sigma-70 factor (ECF subfamily)
MQPRSQNDLIVSLLTSHQQRLLLFVRSLIPNFSDAEEVLQNVSLHIWQHAHEFEPGTDFLRWALQIARYKALAFRTTQSRERARLSETVIEQLAAQGETVLSEHTRYQEALENCLKKLPDKDRQLIALRYESGRSAQGVAEFTGRSSKRIYESLSRIRTQLFECVSRVIAAEERTR